MVADGGAIVVQFEELVDGGEMHVSQSAFSSNVAGGRGGALFQAVPALLANVTLSGNRAGSSGGSVYSIHNLTLAGVSAYLSAAGGDGGTLFVSASEIDDGSRMSIDLFGLHVDGSSAAASGGCLYLDGALHFASTYVHLASCSAGLVGCGVLWCVW